MFTRRKTLVMGGATAAAAALGSIVATGGSTARSAPSPAQDEDVLTFILGIERVEAAFYARAQEVGTMTGELARFVQTVAGHEREHVSFLEQALGSAAPRAQRSTADIDASIRDPERFVSTAAALEDAVVAAYNGQAANLTHGALAKAATIVSVEARHAAWIRDIGGLPPAPRTTDRPLGVDEVHAVLRAKGLIA